MSEQDIAEFRREIVQLLEQLRPPLSHEVIDARTTAILAPFESSDNGGAPTS